MRFARLWPVLLPAIIMSLAGRVQAAVIFNPSGITLPEISGTAAPDTITNEGNVETYISGSSATGNSGTDNGNTITNTGTVAGTVTGSIYGGYNLGSGSVGGGNTVINSGTVSVSGLGYLFGSYNQGDGSVGGGNTLINAGTIGGGGDGVLFGSSNLGIGSVGGGNTLVNSGTVGTSGGDGTLYGSYNVGAGSFGGGNTIMNSGTMSGYGALYGSSNLGIGSVGGGNTITNTATGTVYQIFGSANLVGGSSGGANVISNEGFIDNISGSDNYGAGSSGSSNTIINSGQAGNINGSWNEGVGSSGGGNTIGNSGFTGAVFGSLNEGAGSSGGGNTISNIAGGTSFYLIGSLNDGASSSGGGNSITSSGLAYFSIGSWNGGDGSSGGANTIRNTGAAYFVYGSLNEGDGSSGGGNTIINSGTVLLDLVGSFNAGDGSTSTGNTITNTGTVGGGIWGSENYGAGSSGGNDWIINAGTVGGSIYGMDGDDTVILVGGSHLGGVADGGDGNDTLGFNNMGRMDGSLLGTVYLNFENLGIFGGSTTLTGTWDFSNGIVTIHTGNLFVDGRLSTTILTVERDGLLGGTGSIVGDVVVYGAVSPGHSIGTLTVFGAVDFLPGSAYIVELAANGNCDLLRVSGPVSIDGAELRVQLQRALYVKGRSWRVIEAGGGIHGAFSSIAATFTSYTVHLDQRIQGGSLDVVLNRTPYAFFGDTANRRAVGSALDTVLPSATGAMADLLVAMDFDMDPGQLAATLQALTPEIYTAFPAAGLETAGLFGQAATMRRQEIADRDFAFGASDENRGRLWNVWGRVLGSRLDRDAAAGVPGFSVDTTGVVTGMDRAVGSASYAGLLLGYSDGDLGWDLAGNSGGITGKHVGVYGGTAYAGFRLDGWAGYTGLENSAGRLIATPVGTSRATSSFDSGVWGGNLQLGYDIGLWGLRFGPAVAVEYLRLDQDGFTEKGADGLDVRIGKADLESLTSSLGLRLVGRYTARQWCFLPHAGLTYRHQFIDDPVRLAASFADYPTASFAVVGAEPIVDEMLINVGLSVAYDTDLSLFLEYQASVADEQERRLISGGLSWRF